MKTDSISKPSSDAAALADFLKALAIGEVATYDQLNAVLPSGDVRHECRPAIYKARKTLLDEYQMVFSTVVKVGIKRLADVEVIAQERGHVRRLHKSAKKSMRRLSTVDFQSLDESSKGTHRLVSATLGAVALCSSGPSQLKLEAKLKTGQALEVGETLRLFAKV